MISEVTRGQAYVHFESLELSFTPSPGVRTNGISVSMNGTEFKADSLTLSPSIASALLNLGSIYGAINQNPEANAKLAENLNFTADVRGLFSGDLQLSRSSGAATEDGESRSKIDLALEKMDMKKVSQWADLPVELGGSLSFESDLLVSMAMKAQPEGDYLLTMDRLNMPPSTVPTPLGPLSLPALSLSQVQLKGRWVGESFIIEEGQFGKSGEPLFGRIKGQMGLRIEPVRGASFEPRFGSYNLNVDMTVAKSLKDQLAIAFIMLDNVQSDAGGGRSRYLFRAMGSSLTSGQPAQISRLTQF